MSKLKASQFVTLIASVLLIVSYGGAGQRSPDKQEKIATLERGKVVESEIAGGQAHTYRVMLETGQFLSAVVEQRGVDVAVTIIGPDDKKIAEVDSPNGTQGPEPIKVTANAAGAYRLEIRPITPRAPRGRYAVKIEELLSAEQVKERVAAERARADVVRKWLAKNAIPLRGVEAGAGFEDLQPLKKLIGPARIVSLGEATHGTREFFQLKHRLLEFLVSEMGFTVFGIEAMMPEAFDVNEYVLTGKGDPAKALAGLYFWTWDTEEVLAMIRWMRNYNADPRHEKKVKFYGFDMQSSSRAAKVALAYLHKVDPDPPADAVRALGAVANPFLAQSQQEQPAKQTKAAAAARTLLDCFDRHKTEYVRKSNEREWSIARQHAQILAQALPRSGLERGTVTSALRDRAMADNIQWILEHEGPDAKMVVWAHNGHVGTHTSNGVEWMGSHLRKRYGANMVVFGFAFNQGSFQAMEIPFESGKGLRSFEVKPAPEGSLDAMLATVGPPLAAFDLRALPTDGHVAAWFSQPLATRFVGSGFADQVADRILVKQEVPLRYDALLFIEKTTAARPNAARKWDRPPRLAAPANLDFESGDSGKPPAHWRLPSGIASSNYDVVTSEDNPDGGKRCAMIRRTPGPHYGETFGSLAQAIDAKSFRGQRIKLRAAVRTEVAGPGNQAHLWLRVQKKGVGAASVAFADDMADRPITSREWRVYNIVGDVPKEAESINFGLALVGEGKAWLDSVSIEATPLLEAATVADVPSISGTSKTLDGLWAGTLKTGAVDLRLVFKFAKKGDGWTGTMDSIDQSANGIPVETIEFKKGDVKLELKSIKGVFEGKLKEDGSEITGRWKQSAGDLALTLKRTDKVPAVSRPQHPKKPYPYDEYEVKYDSLQSGVKLAGTLTVPRGKGPFPAVIMLSGSGPQDRDGTMLNHKGFLVIADHLTRNGIAVLRVDDRGVGGSSGSFLNMTYENGCQDVLAGIAQLKSRKEIDAKKIGLIGHSEGGVLAPYVAARSKDVAFLVLLAGTGLPGEEILYMQGQAILKAMGAGEAAMKRQREFQELMFSAIKQESDKDKVKTLIQKRLADMEAKMSPIERESSKSQKKNIDAQIERITEPWFRCFLAHDPRPDLRKVHVPVLALIGEKDVQVPPKVNLEAITKCLAEGGNKDCMLKEMAGLNHMFQTAKTGSTVEYAQIEETFSPAALTLITEWILKRTK